MPLKSAIGCTTKSCKNKAIGYNIHELSHNGTRKRSHRQIVAIAISAATKPKKR